MRDVHPHWHTTQDDAPVAESAPVQPQVIDTVMPANAVVSVSRKPAAIVGILVVAAIGYSLFQGFGGLLGQVADDTVRVRITAEGFDPKIVTARPGQTIVWRNEDSIPHIVFSDTLMMDQDKPLQTSPIFKDGDAEYVLPLDTAPGDFKVASRTKSDFTSTITVELAGSVQPASSAAMSSTPALPETVSSASSSSESPAFPPSPFPTDDFPPFEPEQAAGGIPQNPYTIDSNVIPNPSMSGQVTSRAPLLQHTTGKPQSQPESGPGAVWAIGLFSAALLVICTRKAFTV